MSVNNTLSVRFQMEGLGDQFIAFPEQNDPDYNAYISSKQEFREIAYEGKTNGLFNHQEFVIRYMRPGNGNRRLFMDSYMGTGKTRPPYIIMDMYKDIMVNKPLILVPGDAIAIAHTNEIKELTGMPLSSTEINRRYQFEHYTSFSNKISKLMETEAGIDQIKKEYGHRVIFADEVHVLRDVTKMNKNGTNKREKKTYTYMKQFFQLVMDTTIVILATGTSKMNSATEISMINLILEQDRQIDIAEIEEVVARTTDATLADMVAYFKPYFTGILFYINLNPASLPPMDMQGEKYTWEDLTTREPVVTHIMSDEQRAVYKAIEKRSRKDESDRDKQKSYHAMSIALNWTFPKLANKDPTNFDNYAISYLEDASSNSVGEFRSDVPGLRNWSEGLRDTANIRKYSVKYAAVLESILATPRDVRFCAFSYVKTGVVMFGMLMEMQGYTYYNGAKPLIPTPGNKARRYTIISSPTTPHRLANIIAAENMVENKYGEYLHVILGSPKSGVGISFINTRAMDLMGPAWHKGTEDQTISRVFRASSLRHFDRTDPEQYKIRVTRNAAIEQTYGFTKDIEMYFVSDAKTEEIVHTANAELALSMNTYISSYRNKNIPDPSYAKLPTDYTSWILSGYGKKLENEIEAQAKLVFMIKDSLRLSDISTQPETIVRRVLDDMVDKNTLVRDRWGRQMFVRAGKSNDLYFLQDGATFGSVSVAPFGEQVGNKTYYTRHSTIFAYIRPTSLRSKFIEFMKSTNELSNSEFIDEYLNLFIEIKIVSLELLLSPSGSGPSLRHVVSKARSALILKTMSNNWFIIPGMRCVVHILDQINIDRVRYTANVSTIENTGKLRIYCYDDESPSWRFVNDNEFTPIVQYINEARKANEAHFAERSKIYGIINTTDNNFRIYDESDRDTKDSAKQSTATGYICMDKKKQAMIPMLWKFKIQPPQSIVDEFHKTKQKERVSVVAASNIPGYQATDAKNRELIDFYYYWMQTSIRRDICPALRNYFEEHDLLFIK